MENSTKHQICIIYHYPCYDGSYAALNCFLYYQNFCKKENKITFIPSNSQNRISEVKLEKYNKIYILDKGLNMDDYEYIHNSLLKNTSVKLVCIDHHLSSIKMFNSDYSDKYKQLDNVKLIFEEKAERAASGLTFEYFRAKALKKSSEESVNKIFTDDLYKVLLINNNFYSLMNMLRIVI